MASESAHRPRIGIPYRTQKEEVAKDRSRYDLYVEAVRRANGEPVEISLNLLTSELKGIARSIDAFVLPGSPADVNPALFSAARHPHCADADPARERTDFTLLEEAFGDQKPVLAICYGIQSLNVFLGGTLVQDIPSELHTSVQHNWVGRQQGAPEPFHSAQIDAGSRLSRLAGASDVRVNSSHHQAILEPGSNLRVAARATDGVIEAVEWTGDANWIVGVQWHPERMTPSDRLAQALFSDLVTAARRVPTQA
jgi:putative glutamine amidotransferase